MQKIDYRYFQKARQVAKVSDFPKVHIGCVAIYQGRVIGIGCNTNKTHPQQLYYNRFRISQDENILSGLPKLHAEINCLNAIRHMNIDFKKVKLYIYRIRCDQLHSMARPCRSCMAAIMDLGIRHVYYTTDDGFAYECLNKNETRLLSA